MSSNPRSRSKCTKASRMSINIVRRATQRRVRRERVADEHPVIDRTMQPGNVGLVYLNGVDARPMLAVFAGRTPDVEVLAKERTIDTEAAPDVEDRVRAEVRHGADL